MLIKVDPGRTTVLEEMTDDGAPRFCETEIEGRPLPDLLDPKIICSARFIKIDVEGAESLILKGIEGLIPSFSPRTEVLAEVTDDVVRRLGSSPRKIVDLFAQAGFGAFKMPNSYKIDAYCDTRQPAIVRYDGEPFKQMDLLFRRSPS